MLRSDFARRGAYLALLVIAFVVAAAPQGLP
jgi:hypothetical protein